MATTQNAVHSLPQRGPAARGLYGLDMTIYAVEGVSTP